MDRPNLGSEVFEQIEVEMHFQDMRYWKLLASLQMPTPLATKHEVSSVNDGPPPPLLPVKLSNTITEYVLSLIEVEASKYPKPHPGIRVWMEALARRVEARVLNIIALLEARDSYRSLAHHGLSQDQVLTIIRENAEWAISMYSFDGGPQETKPKPDPVPSEESQIEAATEVALDSEVTRRVTLLNEYKAANGQASNRRIYLAQNSPIHKPQFYKWLSGTLSANSSTTQNFERFLRSKRAPMQPKAKS
jgi:hypothetical protein